MARRVLLSGWCRIARLQIWVDGEPGPGQLAYDKRICILTASQSIQTASENASTRMGLLTYSLVKNGLQDGNADWERHYGKIFLRKWLRYGVKRVPTLYDAIRTGSLDSTRRLLVRTNRSTTDRFLEHTPSHLAAPNTLRSLATTTSKQARCRHG